MTGCWSGLIPRCFFGCCSCLLHIVKPIAVVEGDENSK
jgi:hypothetical protein